MTTNNNLLSADDWRDMPPSPTNLALAVKNYMWWMRQPHLPLDHRFQAIKQQVVFHAIELVAKGGGR